MSIITEKNKIKSAIRKAKTVFLMGHRDLDLDAIGSCIGMYTLLSQKRKKCYIIIDDKTHELGVEKVLRELEGCIEIIKSEDLEKYLNPKENKNLLIILDTNKQDLVQSKEALKIIKNKIIIDHHELGKTTIKDAIIIDDIEASSACEMVTQLVQLYDIELESYYATILLAGIVGVIVLSVIVPMFSIYSEVI